MGRPNHTMLSSLLPQPLVNTRPPLLPTFPSPNFISVGCLVMGSDIPTSEILVSRHRHNSQVWIDLYPGYQHHSPRFRMRMHVPCVITNSPLDSSLTMNFYEKLTLIIASRLIVITDPVIQQHPASEAMEHLHHEPPEGPGCSHMWQPRRTVLGTQNVQYVLKSSRSVMQWHDSSVSVAFIVHVSIHGSSTTRADVRSTSMTVSVIDQACLFLLLPQGYPSPRPGSPQQLEAWLHGGLWHSPVFSFLFSLLIFISPH